MTNAWEPADSVAQRPDGVGGPARDPEVHQGFVLRSRRARARVRARRVCHPPRVALPTTPKSGPPLVRSRAPSNRAWGAPHSLFCDSLSCLGCSAASETLATTSATASRQCGPKRVLMTDGQNLQDLTTKLLRRSGGAPLPLPPLTPPAAAAAAAGCRTRPAQTPPPPSSSRTSAAGWL